MRTLLLSKHSPMAGPMRPKLFSILLFFCIARLAHLERCESTHFVDDLVEEEDSSWLDEEGGVDIVQTRRDARKQSCDMSTGKWVLDASYPLYDSNCPYLSTAVTCQKNGRPDSDYQKWRWKPHACSLPRYHYHHQISDNLL